MSVSKKFCKAEYDNLVAWLKTNAKPEALQMLLPWDAVKDWPGHIVATMDYEATGDIPADESCARQCRIWNEGYRYWWLLLKIRILPKPIPCRGNVGMWPLPEGLSKQIAEAERNAYVQGKL